MKRYGEAKDDNLEQITTVKSAFRIPAVAPVSEGRSQAEPENGLASEPPDRVDLPPQQVAEKKRSSTKKDEKSNRSNSEQPRYVIKDWGHRGPESYKVVWLDV